MTIPPGYTLHFNMTRPGCRFLKKSNMKRPGSFMVNILLPVQSTIFGQAKRRKVPSSGLDTWIDEKRNIAEDFQKAFGQKPPLISSVAIMTDTDNTKESATAYYGDIIFTPK